MPHWQGVWSKVIFLLYTRCLTYTPSPLMHSAHTLKMEPWVELAFAFYFENLEKKETIFFPAPFPRPCHGVQLLQGTA